MINYELKFPEKKKKTRDQIAREWMIDSAKRSSSKGYYDKFKKRILEARKKDDAINKAKKKVGALEWIDSNIALYEKDIATPKQKETLKKMQKRLATKPTEENLYNTYIQMLQEGTLKPMSFEDFEKNFSGLDVQVKKPKNVRDPSFKKKPTSPVKINWDLGPETHTAKLWPKIRDSALYKTLDSKEALGVELGHETIISIMDLLQSSGFLKHGGRVK